MKIDMKRFLLTVILMVFLPVVALADLEIRFLNIGQGDAAIVICDGETMVIYGGPGSEASLMNTVVKNSTESVKYLVATHPHEDHVGGGNRRFVCCTSRFDPLTCT